MAVTTSWASVFSAFKARSSEKWSRRDNREKANFFSRGRTSVCKGWQFADQAVALSMLAKKANMPPSTLCGSTYGPWFSEQRSSLGCPKEEVPHYTYSVACRGTTRRSSTRRDTTFYIQYFTTWPHQHTTVWSCDKVSNECHLEWCATKYTCTMYTVHYSPFFFDGIGSAPTKVGYNWIAHAL